MKCAKCKADIGEIKNAITTAGCYSTDKGGAVEIRIINLKAVVFNESERCADCYDCYE